VPGWRPYAGEYKRIARENEAIFINNLMSGIFSDTTLRSDEIHPNAAGYRLIARRLAGKIGKYAQ